MKPLIYYGSIKEYKYYFEEKYCKKPIITFDSIPVYFRKSIFDHCFFESNKIKDDTFSRKRAERIDWIKETLENPKSDLRYGWNNKKKMIDYKRRVAIVNGNYVVIITLSQNRHGNLKGNFLTAFVADNSINKILNTPKWRKK